MMITILFAGEAKSIREFCKRQLEDEGYRVLLARDAAAAIARTKQRPADVVILDLCTLGRGGLDAVKPIKAIAPDIPIILFTADDQARFRDGRSRLATACVKKSEDLTELKRVIVTALSLRDANESPRSRLEATQVARRPVPSPVSQRALHEAARGPLTTSVAVNAAFLQEIKDDYLELQQLLVEIRGALAGPGSLRGLWEQFVRLLGDLRDGLAMYFRLEETYGYVENPVSVAPRLSRHAQTLRKQHQRLYSEVCAIFEQAEQRLDREAGAGTPRKIIQRFTAFCDQLREHEGCEDDLIFQAFTEGASGKAPGHRH